MGHYLSAVFRLSWLSVSKVASTMVADPIRDWQQMAGSTDLVKKLNALITTDQVLAHDVPHDECLTEAEWVVQMTEESDIAEFLINLFARTDEGESLGPDWEASCRRTAGRVMWVKSGHWPPS